MAQILWEWLGYRHACFVAVGAVAAAAQKAKKGACQEKTKRIHQCALSQKLIAEAEAFGSRDFEKTMLLYAQSGLVGRSGSDKKPSLDPCTNSSGSFHFSIKTLRPSMWDPIFNATAARVRQQAVGMKGSNSIH